MKDKRLFLEDLNADIRGIILLDKVCSVLIIPDPASPDNKELIHIGFGGTEETEIVLSFESQNSLDESYNKIIRLLNGND